MSTADRGARPKRLCTLFFAGAALLFAQYGYILLVQDFYPSISLPAGAGEVRDGATFDRNRWIVFALGADGSRFEIDEHELLAPLPSSYRVFVVENGFGLLPGSRASDEDRRVARAWLRERLRPQLGGIEAVAIEVVHVRVTARARAPRPQLPVATRRIDL